MNGILTHLETLYASREEEVERWLGKHRGAHAPYITTSVDLRHSGTRLVPVDTNLYPAGFQNLSQAGRRRAARWLSHWLDAHHPEARRALLLPESHTRNLPYLDNLLALQEIMNLAGLETEIGSLAAPKGEVLALTSASGRELQEKPLLRNGDTLVTEDGFKPDIILLNNDFSGGLPELVEGLSQPICPPPSMGWHRRKKSVHFAAYAALARDFAESFGFDPWLISAEFRHADGLDFKHHAGLETLAQAVEEVLQASRAKYREHGIEGEPYAFIKADSGTYGMGIMTVRSAQEVFEMNKKERNKMQVVKEGMQVSDVLVQEGVPTIDTVKGAIAEPMVYLIDGIPAGGMYRVNPTRDAFSNLNAAGMEFTGMCDEGEGVDDCRQVIQNCQFRPFGLIAALAALAAAGEVY